jgi:SAM-dependent methyltransferase
VDHPSLDTSVPNVARMHDYLLGGRENFQADRNAVESLLKLLPDLKQTVRDNRAFLRRVVLYLAEQGIGQFLDVGSGLPTQENVHEIAHRVNPDAKVAYVDHDPIVVSHGNALLAKSKQVVVVSADFRQARALLDLPSVKEHLDLTRPVAVILLQVLHYIADDDDVARIVAAFKDALCPGSYLVIGQATEDHVPQQLAARVLATYRRSGDLWPRSEEQVRRLFHGFELIEPGLTPGHAWRPGSSGAPKRQAPTGWVGVARKP